MQGPTDKFRQDLALAAQALADASQVPVFVTLPNAEYVYVNATLQRLLGLELEKGVTSVAKVFSPSSVQTLETIGQGPLGPSAADLVLVRRDAPNHEAKFKIVLMRNEKGQHLTFGTVALDVNAPAFESETSREISHFLEHESPVGPTSEISLETQVFRFAERSTVGLLVLDEAGLCRYVNSTLERILDTKRDKMLGRPLDAFVKATSQEAFYRRVVQRLVTREGGTQTVEIEIPEVGRREISFRWYPISESPKAMGFVVSDVTTTMVRRRSRHALSLLSSNSNATEVLQGMRSSLRAESVAMIAAWRPESLVVDAFVDGSEVNHQGACNLRDASEMLQIAYAYMGKHGVFRHEHKLLSRKIEGSDSTFLIRPIENISGNVEGFLGLKLVQSPDGWSAYEEAISAFARRMSMLFESQRRAENIVERRKRESLEELARGIAHDFNNVLMSISGHLQLIQRKVGSGPDERLARNVEHALRSSERGKQLVAAMIAFSENTMPTMAPVDLGASAKAAVDRATALFGKSIAMATSIEDGLLILGDTRTLQDSIEALLLNARDAVTDAAQLKEDFAPRVSIVMERSRSQEGDAVVKLTVSDNGVGMGVDVQRRIFDPFYTTREPGKGTGLGMAVVQASVARMSGTIDVQSKLGEGSSITLTFPAYEDTPDARPLRDTDSFQRTDTKRLRAKRAKHILVVDDSNEQRDLIVEFLNEEGYSTEDVSNGIEAIAMVQERRQDFDLMILDRLMPRMPGDETARRTHQIAPDLPMIILSGIVEDDFREEMQHLGVVECLQKPVGIDDLINTIDGILKRKRTTGRRL